MHMICSSTLSYPSVRT